MSNKVDIVVERQWHAPSLAKALMSTGSLGTIHTGFPPQRYTSLGIPAAHLSSHPFAAIWNLGVSKLGLPAGLRKNEPLSLANHVASERGLAPVVTCLATSYQHLFPKLVHRPVVRVIECGSMHPEDHFLFQQRGRREANLPHSEVLPASVKAESEASKLAHFLVCGSRMVADSYIRRGYREDRVLICPYGVDTNRFRTGTRSPAEGRAIRLATVGVIGIRKGIVRLLKIAEWAEQAGIAVELDLIGPLEPEAETLINNSRARCNRRGVLKGDALVEALHACDAYCLPSYEEGFPISQIEAMATGLPAITSDDTGGREAVECGKDGIILKDFTTEEFNSKLMPFLTNPAGLLEAGNAAAEKARRLYSLEAYTANVKRSYQLASDSATALLGGEPLAPAHQA